MNPNDTSLERDRLRVVIATIVEFRPKVQRFIGHTWPGFNSANGFRLQDNLRKDSTSEPG